MEVVGAWSDVVSFQVEDIELMFDPFKQPSPGVSGDVFGASVCFSSDGIYAAVAATYDSATVSNGGAVYIYKQEAGVWVQKAKLTPSELRPGDGFGTSVALNATGTVLVVGAANGSNGVNNPGYIAVFTRNEENWSQETKIYDTNSLNFSLFGQSVSIDDSGTVIAVGTSPGPVTGVTGFLVIYEKPDASWIRRAQLGEPGNQTTLAAFSSISRLSSSGLRVATYSRNYDTNVTSVHIYHRTASTWAKLISFNLPSASVSGLGFDFSGDGTAVAVKNSANDIVLYRENGENWVVESTLTYSDLSATGDGFGSAVSLNQDGTRVVIGASNQRTNTGAAYLFSKVSGIWKMRNKLTTVDGITGAYFGNRLSVSKNGEAVVVSSSPASGLSAVYFFPFLMPAIPVNEVQKIYASDAQIDDNFGQSVSISSDGNTVLVGAHFEDPSDINAAGSAYVFTRSGSVWVQEAKLTASDKAAGDYFGFSVALSADGNTAAIGAFYVDLPTKPNAGAVYIFTRNAGTWSQQAKIVADDSAGDDYFGFSVALSGNGNTVLIGSRYEDPSNLDAAGSAYVFARAGSAWSQQAKLVASDAQANDEFGFSVALSKDGLVAIVGAPYEDPTGIANAGSAYVFTYSNGSWTQQAKLVASDAQANDYFGINVALSENGTTALVGAYYEDPGNLDAAGSAYVFTQASNSWSQQAKLIASDGEVGDQFGFGLSLSSDGNMAVIGAFAEDGGSAINSGAAYVFTRSGAIWSQRAKLIASDRATDDSFGRSLSLSGDKTSVIIGARSEDPNGISNAGSAYIFTV